MTTEKRIKLLSEALLNLKDVYGLDSFTIQFILDRLHKLSKLPVTKET